MCAAADMWRRVSRERKRAPAPLSADEREETLRVLDRLTEEQRRMLLIQARAVADSND